MTARYYISVDSCAHTLGEHTCVEDVHTSFSRDGVTICVVCKSIIERKWQSGSFRPYHTYAYSGICILFQSYKTNQWRSQDFTVYGEGCGDSLIEKV